MRSLLIPALLAGFAWSAPGGARLTDGPNSGPAPRPPAIGDSSLPGPSVGRELRDVRHRVERARDGGLLTRSEARSIRREARLVGRLEERYARDGLSAAEREELRTRTRLLREAIAHPRLARAGRR